MQAITCVISYYAGDSSVVYVIEILRLCDGSHLLQENLDGRYTYIYPDPDSYELLAQVHNHTSAEGESCQEVNYFHCDHIDIPRKMTDKDGNFLWFGNYTGWGRLKEETKVTDNALTNLSAYRTSTLTVRQSA